MKIRRTTMGIAVSAALLLAGVGAWAHMDSGEGRLLPYEGHLDLDGKPQNGTFDFRFALFDNEAESAACLAAEPLACPKAQWSDTIAAVAVNGGAFGVTLGEGAKINDATLASAELFLAIAVRQGGDAGSDPFTVLQGKQRLLAVPFAARAAAAKNYSVSGNLSANSVSTTGTFVAGEVIAKTQSRIVSDSFGAILRNDSGSFSITPTKAGDPYGASGAPKPLQIDLATGNVTMADVTMGDVTVSKVTAGTITGTGTVNSANGYSSGGVAGCLPVAGGVCVTGLSSFWDAKYDGWGGAACTPTPISTVACPNGTTKHLTFYISNMNVGGEGAICCK